MAELKAVQKRQSRGNLMEVQAAGITSRRSYNQLSVTRAIERIRYALFMLAGTTKGPNTDKSWPNPYDEKVRTTAARYSYP